MKKSPYIVYSILGKSYTLQKNIVLITTLTFYLKAKYIFYWNW